MGTIRTGEEVAALYRRHVGMVYQICLMLLKNVPDAEDATQEILVKVMTRLATFKGQSAFTTWVFRVAANHLQSYRKHLFAQHPLSLRNTARTLPAAANRTCPTFRAGWTGRCWKRSSSSRART